MTEEWKTIDNFPNYIISNTGIVKNIKTGRILKQATQSAGYSIVCLSNGKQKQCPTIHRLVMNTFYPNPDPKIYTDINHKDKNRGNNSIDNLEWCTHSYNMKYNYVS